MMNINQSDAGIWIRLKGKSGHGKNRIREHGKNGFMVEEAIDGARTWLLRASGGWRGWLPKHEFHLECIGEEFFVEKFDQGLDFSLNCGILFSR